MSEAEHLAALGLEPGASPEAVKAAYRRVARENHPDRNPDDPAAAERFRRAAEAYRALRAGGSVARGRPSERPAAERPSDAFEQVFGRGRQRRREPGVDLKYTLTLGFLEAAGGGERWIRVPGKATCKRCGGTGAELGSSPILCRRCEGRGSVGTRQGFFERPETCPECLGRGRVQTDPCRACQGVGEVDIEREVPVAFSPGVTSGTRLRVAGEGQPGTGGAPPGDLYVVIEVEPHPLFERDGDDLLVEVPVGFALAAAGGHVRVPTLDGVVRMRVPPGSGSGRVFRLKGKGIAGKGDQRVVLRVEVPERLSAEARAALDAYAALEAEHDLLPGRRAYLDALAAFERE